MSVEAYACTCGTCVCSCSDTCICSIDELRWDNKYDIYVNTRDYLVSYNVFQVVHQFGGQLINRVCHATFTSKIYNYSNKCLMAIIQVNKLKDEIV